MEKNIRYNHRPWPWPWPILLTSYKLIIACGWEPIGSEAVTDTREWLVGRKHMVWRFGPLLCDLQCCLERLWKPLVLVSSQDDPATSVDPRDSINYCQ